MKIQSLKIEMLLAEQRITKADLARKCNMPRQNIGTIIKRGSCEPKTAGKLAAGLGVPVAEIVCQEV